jgi:hypothetical protein
MKAIRMFWCVLAILLVSTSVKARQLKEPILSRTQLFLDSEIGGKSGLAYYQPSTNFGRAFEVPVGDRFEMEASARYSPDKKVITNNGNQLLIKGSGIFWLTSRFGISGSYQHNWLWTSEFNEEGRNPLIGSVVRNHFAQPGRFYMNYVFPTGCVRATVSNPCPIQSKSGASDCPRISNDASSSVQGRRDDYVFLRSELSNRAIQSKSFSFSSYRVLLLYGAIPRRP